MPPPVQLIVRLLSTPKLNRREILQRTNRTWSMASQAVARARGRQCRWPAWMGGAGSWSAPPPTRPRHRKGLPDPLPTPERLRPGGRSRRLHPLLSPSPATRSQERTQRDVRKRKKQGQQGKELYKIRCSAARTFRDCDGPSPPAEDMVGAATTRRSCGGAETRCEIPLDVTYFFL